MSSCRATNAKPDMEKLQAYGREILQLITDQPSVETEEASELLAEAVAELLAIALRLGAEPGAADVADGAAHVHECLGGRGS
jgi:hypothetical protein